jgi:predicted  nucleic acid-binding Zn-ribbon protein
MLPNMGEPPDLETRVTALETQVRELNERVEYSERDAAAVRVLAGGADRDVSEMRREIRDFREQNTRVLNAMREDLSDFRSAVDEKFARVDQGFAEMRGKLDAAAAGQQQIAGMLGALIARDEGQAGPG